MPKTTLERNTFVRGLITEASPLTFPENASISETNFVLNRDGSRQRRLGMDYESGYSMLDSDIRGVDLPYHKVSGFKWENVNNNGSITLLVVHAGPKLWFFDSNADVISTQAVDTISLSSIQAQAACQYAYINGNLIITNKNFAGPMLVEYDDSTQTVSSSFLELEVRDMWGVDDGLETTERNAYTANDLPILHEYNLFNQGWPTRKVKTKGGGRGYPHYFQRNSGTPTSERAWPSNADIWFLGKDNAEVYDADFFNTADVGDRPAPKGRNIIRAFKRGEDRRKFMADAGDAVQSSDPTSDIPVDFENGTVTAVAAYGGRLFYSGVDSVLSNGDDESPSYAGMIFFTQLVDNKNDLIKCYSVNDITSEEFPDILPTDGGTINIPEASRILKLINKDTSLLVFAENGVWQITGPDGVFKGDDFSISQVTNIGCIGADTIVNAEGVIYYWGKGGVYVLGPDERSGRLSATNITETTIQTLYNNISSVAKEQAKGVYDSSARRISWLYDNGEASNVVYKDKYTKELVLDVVLGAFYLHNIGSLDTNSPYVAGYIETADFVSLQDSQPVVVNGEQLVVNGEDVVVTSDIRGRGFRSLKYITIVPNKFSVEAGMTFSLYTNPRFLDWEAEDSTGVDAAAQLVTGYELFNDTMRRKYVPYLITHFERTETSIVDTGGELSFNNPSSCIVQAQWDWNNSVAAGKWSNEFQAYKLPRNFTASGASTLDYGYSVITTKNRLRGSGRAISLQMRSEEGKDLYIYGWGMVVEGGSNV
jgi:hypothetical protein